MLGALHGQRAGAVMQDKLRHAGEGTAVLPQHVLIVSGPGELQVQEALAAPADRCHKGLSAPQTHSSPKATPSWPPGARDWHPKHFRYTFGAKLLACSTLAGTHPTLSALEAGWGSSWGEVPLLEHRLHLLSKHPDACAPH